jgi:hypothetical protein
MEEMWNSAGTFPAENARNFRKRFKMIVLILKKPSKR